LELAAGPTEALRFVVYDVIAPSICVNGSFEVPRHDAEVILLLPGPDRSARRLVVSLATDDQSSGRFLVEARDRRMVIGGQHGCVPRDRQWKDRGERSS